MGRLIYYQRWRIAGRRSFGREGAPEDEGTGSEPKASRWSKGPELQHRFRAGSERGAKDLTYKTGSEPEASAWKRHAGAERTGVAFG
jgi:hypothetical protein